MGSGWLDQTRQESLRGLFRRSVPDRNPAPPSDVDHKHAAAVVDLALRVAELAIQTGSLTSEATSFALTVTTAYGLTADIDVTWASVTISYHRRGRAEPITGFRAVRTRLTNYTLLSQLLHLIDDIGTGRVELDDAIAKFENLRNDIRPYRSWVVCLGQAALGAGVAAILGGRPMEIFLAAVANAVLFVVQLALARTSLSVFFIQAIGASIPTALAVGVMQVRASETTIFATVSPSLIVASGIVSLLAGVGIVAAARDAMEGNVITAGARAFDAVLQTAGIVVGVIVTLWLGFKMGVEGYIAPTAGYGTSPLLQLVSAVVIAVGVGFGFQLGIRAVPFAALLAAVGFGTYLWSETWIGNWPGAAAMGAAAVGFCAQIVAGRWRIPHVALITTGIVAMMPGSALYRGLYHMIESFDGPISVQAQISLGQAVMIGFALAAGSSLGSQIARPLGLPTAKLFRVSVLRTQRRLNRTTASTESVS